MLFDFRNQRICIFGLQGSGKTFFAKKLVQQTQRPFIYDPLKEYSDIAHAITYAPKHRKYCPAAGEEVDQVIQYMIEIDPLPTLFLMDEANRFIPNKRPLPEMVSFLNDFQRHIPPSNEPIGLCFIARRPAQLNTDLPELAHYLVIFNVVGKNDMAYLESVARGLGEAACRLKPYHFIIVDPRRQYKIFPPVTP